MSPRTLWHLLLAVVLALVPVVEVTAAPAHRTAAMACDGADKAAAVPMTCLTCCALPAEAIAVTTPAAVSMIVYATATSTIAGIEPTATSPPPRSFV